MYKNGLNMKVVSKLMPLHMALTVHLTLLTEKSAKAFKPLFWLAQQF